MTSTVFLAFEFAVFGPGACEGFQTQFNWNPQPALGSAWRSLCCSWTYYLPPPHLRVSLSVAFPASHIINQTTRESRRPQFSTAINTTTFPGVVPPSFWRSRNESGAEERKGVRGFVPWRDRPLQKNNLFSWTDRRGEDRNNSPKFWMIKILFLLCYRQSWELDK